MPPSKPSPPSQEGIRREIEAWCHTVAKVGSTIVMVALAAWAIVQILSGHPPGLDLLSHVLSGK